MLILQDLLFPFSFLPEKHELGYAGLTRIQNLIDYIMEYRNSKIGNLVVAEINIFQ